MNKVTLGGDRLGAGNKNKVELHGFERSTFNLSKVWRSTMASGTLVPFMKILAQPADTFDINLGCDVKTHPTVGPLFGSYKVQLDVFVAPIRLYNALLHNNMLGIGMKMSQVKLPRMSFDVKPLPVDFDLENIDNAQVNPSCILSYLGIRGFGLTDTDTTRDFNITPLLMYWDTYKQYYSNKQEEIGAVLHTPQETLVETVDSIKIFHTGSETTLPEAPTSGSIPMVLGDQIRIYYTGTQPIPTQEIISTVEHGDQTADALSTGIWTDATTYIWSPFRQTFWGDTTATNWRYKDSGDINTGLPAIQTFPLSNIDDMRLAILAYQSKTAPFEVGKDSSTNGDIAPYNYLNDGTATFANCMSSQEGLGLKTYQSDLLNNWLQTEWIDGVDGISAITAIDTSGGSFTIDTFILSRKVYDMLNRIMVSGGTADNWIEAVYDHEPYTRCESPIYMGGLIKELLFQEVVSNSASSDQPLGTLAGKGVLGSKHKGGSVTIKVDEPSYIMGIVSLTPRLDYSQGNDWDIWLETVDDIHKPNLDQIGFQELPTERMAWWDTKWDGTKWVQMSAGKQPAWIEYMTAINETRGNFAVSTNEMFMTLNRRYEIDEDTKAIKDVTTYIDPSKFNFIFAETALDSQNFWVQIAVDVTARRKMSAKVIPNL